MAFVQPVTTNDQITVRYTRWIIANKFKVMAASLLISLGLGSGGRFLEFTNDYRVFFGKDNPQLLAFEELENTYTKNDNILLILTPKSGEVFSRETLAAVEDLTERAWQVPYSTRVDSLTNFQHTRAVGDDLYVDRLVRDARSLSPTQLEEIRTIALAESQLVRRLISPDSRVTGVNISIQLPKVKLDEVMEVAGFVRNLLDEFEKQYPNFILHHSGFVMLNHAFMDASMKDMSTLMPLMYLAILIIMALLLRSGSGTIVALVVLILSIMSAMGTAGYAGVKLTPPSAIAPTVILTLAIADTVHILVSMRLFMQKGMEKIEALVESLRVNMLALFLTSFTTMIGFLSLNFSEVPPYHDLGNITAVGVVYAFFFSVVLLPALTAALPFKVPRPVGEKTSWYSRYAKFVVARSRVLLAATSVAAVVLIACVPRLELDDQFIRYFDHRIEFRRSTEYMLKNLTGIYQIEYSISAGEPDGITDPRYMKTLEDFANWWRAHDEVMHVASFTDTMKRLNRSLHADEASWYRLPDDADLAAQYILLYEMSLPYGLDLNNQITIDKSATKLTITLEEQSTTQMRALAGAGDAWLMEHGAEPMWVKGSGPSVMFSYISQRNIEGMIIGTSFAFVMITIILIVALRSWKYGLLSIIPNVVPALMAFGLWQLIQGQVTMAVAIVAAATLGIIVDDTVHFLTKYLRARKEQKLTAPEAVEYAFTNVGKALVVTSVILIIGFGLLGTSAFRLNMTLGLLSAMTIAFALILDFTMLPALLLSMDTKRRD